MSEVISPDAQANNAGNMGEAQLFEFFKNSGSEDVEPVVESQPEEVEDTLIEPGIVEPDSAEETVDNQEEPEVEEESVEEEEETEGDMVTKEKLNTVIQERLARQKKQFEAERKELEERLAQLESHASEATPQAPRPASTVQEIEAELSQAQGAIEVVSKALSAEPSEYDDKGQPLYDIEGNEFSRHQLEQVQAAAFDVVRQAPARRDLVVQRDAFSKSLEEKFDFFTDKSSKEYPLVQSVMNSDIYRVVDNASPYAKELAARYVLSERWIAAEKRKAQAQKKPVKKPVKKKAGKAATAVGTPAPRPSNAPTDRKKIIAGGNLDAAKLKQFFLTE